MRKGFTQNKKHSRVFLSGISTFKKDKIDEISDCNFRGCNNRAFTLIELLVVVLIIGILAAIALPQYTKAVEKAKMAEAFTNMDTIKKAVNMYLLQQGRIQNASFEDILEAAGLELSGGQWNNVSYETRNFEYGAWCWASSNSCEIQVNKSQSNGFIGYSLYLVYKDGQGWFRKECVTQDTDYGRTMCKGLTDWTYNDTEL